MLTDQGAPKKGQALPRTAQEVLAPVVSDALWRSHVEQLKAAFPSPWRESDKDRSFENTFRRAVALVDQLKHPPAPDPDALKGYLGLPNLPDYSQCRDAKMSERMMPQERVIAELAALFDGMPNWNHPQTMANVIPPANTASIIGATLSDVFSPNIIEGEYSWNVAKTEIESAAMVADMVGWNPKRAGGLFTFGGTGCYLYGTKYALTAVLGKSSRNTGIRVNAKILVSQEGHYVKENCSDWSGLGMNNVIQIPVDEKNRMSIPHLKRALARCQREGNPVAMIVCTAGTTDAFAIDPVKEVRQLVDQYENAGGHPKPLIYVDGVIGWSWVAFGTYDFEKNPLQFSEQALRVIRSNYEQIKNIRYADAIGCDFHKTGWSPYNCSLFLVKDYDRFTKLLIRKPPTYLQDRTEYNPGHYTLETSRTGAYSMAGWASLRLFGREGLQTMLGRIIEVEIFFRSLLAQDDSLVCTNPEDHGFVTLFRVYPEGINANEQYEKELRDPAYREELYYFNMLQQEVANKLFAMLRDPSQRVPGWEYPPYTSFTAGFRPSVYNPKEQDTQYWIYALKAFPMSINSDEFSMALVRAYVLKARDLVIAEQLSMREQAPELAKVASASMEPCGPEPCTWWGPKRLIPKKYLQPGSQ